MTSSVKPLAGPGATPSAWTSPSWRSAAIPAQTSGLVYPVRSGLWSSSTSNASAPMRSSERSVAIRR